MLKKTIKESKIPKKFKNKNEKLIKNIKNKRTRLAREISVNKSKGFDH